MLQSVLAWIEVLLIDLLLDRLHFLLDHLIDLLLCQLLAVEPRHALSLLDDLPAGFLHHKLLLRNRKLGALLDQGRCGHLVLMESLIVEGLLKVDLDIGLDNTDLILRFAVNDVNQVVFALVVDIDSVSLH